MIYFNNSFFMVFMTKVQAKRTSYFYRPQTKLRKGTVFTSRCPVHGRGCLPKCMLGYTPWADTPQADIPSPGQTPPPLRRHPLGRHSLGRHPPLARHPSPSRRLLPQAVHILLECILVYLDVLLLLFLFL